MGPLIATDRTTRGDTHTHTHIREGIRLLLLFALMISSSQ